MSVKASDPIRIGTKTVRNRITMAPTVKFDWAEADGIPNQRLADHYALRAKLGCGLICVEATCVTPTGRLDPKQLGLWDDNQIAGHKLITDAVHAEGSTVIVQIHHGGFNIRPEVGPLKGPSVVNCRSGVCEALMLDEIHLIQQQFVEAAVRAQKAGYDGIQLHGCHRYLINQFQSPEMNLRTDEYGGSLENRVRFGVEIIRMIREAVGKDFIISNRTPGYEPDTASAIAACEAYVAAGADYLQISDGFDQGYHDEHDAALPYSDLAELGVNIRKHFKGIVPVSCINIRTPEEANYLIENDLIDTVDLARPILADPKFSNSILHNTDYVKCFNCKRCLWGPMIAHKCPAASKRKKAEGSVYPDLLD